MLDPDTGVIMLFKLAGHDVASKETLRFNKVIWVPSWHAPRLKLLNYLYISYVYIYDIKNTCVLTHELHSVFH